MFRTDSVLLTVALALWIAQPVLATTQCTSAQGWVEMAICADTELLDLSKRVGELLAHVDETRQAPLIKSVQQTQRQFLLARETCRTAKDRTPPVTCLLARYRKRVSQLETELANAKRFDPPPSMPPVETTHGAIDECLNQSSERAALGACLNRKLEAANTALATSGALTQKALRQLGPSNANPEGLEPLFLAAQTAFLQFREANCRWRAATGGSASENDSYKACLADLARQRADELRARLGAPSPRQPPAPAQKTVPEREDKRPAAEGSP